MGDGFRPVERDQLYLMPVSVRDWLPDDHLAPFLVDVVGGLDLSAARARRRADGHGAPAYDPAVMVGLLLYAYCTGEYSSRRIETRCREDVGFRVVAANATPDHATIARFRATRGPLLRDVFHQVLRVCAEAGMGRLGTVALDGTKLSAPVSSASVRSVDALDALIAGMLERAAATDAEEDARYGADRRGDELPADLADPGTRRAALAAARRRLAERERLDRLGRARDQLAGERAGREADVAAALERRAARGLPTDPVPGTGQGPRVDAVRRRGWAQRSTTDPDARLMKGGGRDGWVVGYNAQAVVSEDGLVIAHDLTQQANDTPHLAPMLAAARANARAAGMGTIGALVADAGYWRETNGALDRPWGTRVLLKPNPGKRRGPRSTAPPRPERERMTRRLAHPRNAARYRRRGAIVEVVFGQVKEGRCFRRFSRRGRDACAEEWVLLCTAHDLLKVWRHGTRRRPAARDATREAGRAGGTS